MGEKRCALGAPVPQGRFPKIQRRPVGWRTCQVNFLEILSRLPMIISWGVTPFYPQILVEVKVWSHIRGKMLLTLKFMSYSGRIVRC